MVWEGIIKQLTKHVALRSCAVSKGGIYGLG